MTSETAVKKWWCGTSESGSQSLGQCLLPGVFCERLSGSLQE